MGCSGGVMLAVLRKQWVRLWGHQAELGGWCFPCGIICAMWTAELSRVLASWPCCLEGIVKKHKKVESKKWRSEESSPNAGIKPMWRAWSRELNWEHQGCVNAVKLPESAHWQPAVAIAKGKKPILKSMKPTLAQNNPQIKPNLSEI